MEARVRERETKGRVEFAEKKKMRVGFIVFLEKDECYMYNKYTLLKIYNFL